MADNAGIKVAKLKSQMYASKSTTTLERHLKIAISSICRFEVLLHSFLDFSETCRHHENVVPHCQKEKEKNTFEDCQHRMSSATVLPIERRETRENVMTERCANNKRSREKSGLWDGKTSYHESISLSSQAALTQQCEHAITEAK